MGESQSKSVRTDKHSSNGGQGDKYGVQQHNQQDIAKRTSDQKHANKPESSGYYQPSDQPSLVPSTYQIIDQSNMSQEQLASLVERLEKVTCRLENAGGATKVAASSDEDAAFVTEYDDVVSGPLNDFLAASAKIGGLVNDQALLLKKAVAAQKAYLVIASKSKKPDQTVTADLLKPTSDMLTAIMDIKEKNRRSDQFNHLSALAEGVGALGWVTVEPTPAPFVKDMADAGMFYVNRVLKEFKEKNPVHSDWTKALCSLWRELQAYVKQHHTTGLTWNMQGGDAKATASAAPAGPPGPPAGGPPPPPAPAPMPASAPSAASKEAPDASALFASINMGGDITKGLKKVTADQQTHKNPALRAAPPSPGLKKVTAEQQTHKNPALRQGPAPFKPSTAPKPPATKPKPTPAVPAAKPPLVELAGKKWNVEYLNNSHDTVIDDTNNKQVVYLYKCTNSTVVVKGKVNSVILDNCKKTAVVFDDAISMVEFVNCQSVKAQVMGKVPTVSIEKTDGCQVYLSKDSLNTEFISAKSSEMNVVLPTPDGDYIELAIAEQFKTVIKGKTLVTTVNDIAA